MKSRNVLLIGLTVLLLIAVKDNGLHVDVLTQNLLFGSLLVLIGIIILMDRKKVAGIDIKRFGPTKMDTIAMAWAVVLGLTIFSLSDKAIQIPNVAIPYGLVWTWLNPYYWTGALYKWIILAVQILVMIPQYYLAKKGKLNWRMLHLLLFTTIYFRLMGVFQEVTPVIFAPFVTINPAFSLLMLIQKYPFWTLIPNFSDSHYQCSILGQCGGYTVDRNIYFHGALNPDIATHALLVFWLITPIYAWWKKRQCRIANCPCPQPCSECWNEDRFWMKMMLPASAIMMFGFVVLMFFGCCAGYHWFL